MEITSEQLAIIKSTGNIKINAVAGSGKTTTVIEYAKTRPKDSKILYIAFNKSVKLEAAKKFADKGLDNVKVETAHSLAYKHIVFKHKYVVRQQGYKTNEIADLLKLQVNGDKHARYVIANHIGKFITYFCNSDKQKVSELNYRDTIVDAKAKTFVTTFYSYIEKQVRIFLGKMDTGEIEITHDFYLKKFQLSNQKLDYDYILFDEGQDASAAMLDIFFKQNATKVIVGDTHQQIYSWRYAVNALGKADYKTFNLSTSFRFSQDIANLAMRVLKWKEHIEEYKPVAISGKGAGKQHETKAIIARTNLGLLLKAIEYVTENENVKHIYFEGNINSYTYADEGTSLYDVLNLYNHKHSAIKDNLIKAMRDIDELEDYIKKTEDKQLGMMLEIVKQYGNDIYGILNTIKEKHVEKDEKEKAEMIFSTVHRCKGMEYDVIHIVDDFITEKKLEKAKDDKQEEGNIARLNEEINLLYVAVTRAKNIIHMPEILMPVNFPVSTQIRIIKTESKEAKKPIGNPKVKPGVTTKTSGNKRNEEKAYSVESIRTKSKDAYKPWTSALDKELRDMLERETTIRALAKHFGRTEGAIRSRITKLELEEI